MPERRRIWASSTSGKFTAWNGLTFNFETILPAHDNRLATASNDPVVQLWSFAVSREERTLTGHGLDVKYIECHLMMGLVPRSKRNPIQFWNPLTGTVLTSLYLSHLAVQGQDVDTTSPRYDGTSI